MKLRTFAKQVCHYPDCCDVVFHPEGQTVIEKKVSLKEILLLNIPEQLYLDREVISISPRLIQTESMNRVSYESRIVIHVN